jgi:hypothetical protein
MEKFVRETVSGTFVRELQELQLRKAVVEKTLSAERVVFHELKNTEDQYTQSRLLSLLKPVEERRDEELKVLSASALSIGIGTVRERKNLSEEIRIRKEIIQQRHESLNAELDSLRGTIPQLMEKAQQCSTHDEKSRCVDVVNRDLVRIEDGISKFREDQATLDQESVKFDTYESVYNTTVHEAMLESQTRRRDLLKRYQEEILWVKNKFATDRVTVSGTLSDKLKASMATISIHELKLVDITSQISAIQEKLSAKDITCLREMDRMHTIHTERDRLFVERLQEVRIRRDVLKVGLDSVYKRLQEKGEEMNQHQQYYISFMRDYVLALQFEDRIGARALRYMDELDTLYAKAHTTLGIVRNRLEVGNVVDDDVTESREYIGEMVLDLDGFLDTCPVDINEITDQNIRAVVQSICERKTHRLQEKVRETRLVIDQCLSELRV